jgi:hypothetical protein
MKYLSLVIPGNGGAVDIVPPRGIIHTGGASSLNSIISVGLNLAVMAGIIVCLFMLIWGGFDWLMSEGDKQKLSRARQRLAMSILGLIVVLISFMIINIIYTFFFNGAMTVNFLGSQ